MIINDLHAHFDYFFLSWDLLLEVGTGTVELIPIIK